MSCWIDKNAFLNRNRNMIKETIRILNVGPIKDSGIINIKPITVFVGDSASGKSTLMKIVALMRYVFKRVVIRSYIKNSDVNEKLFYIRIKDMLRDDIKQLVNDNSSIFYNVEIEGVAYSISYVDGKLLSPEIIPNQHLFYSKEVWVSEMRSAIAPLSARGSFAKNATLGFYFDETFSSFDEATNEVKHFDLNYVGLDMDVVKGGNNQKRFELTPKDGSYGTFELRHASSGIQTTAPLLALIAYYATTFSFKAAQKRNIIDLLFEKDLTTQYNPKIELADLPKLVHFHIEEPELSLDPTSQLRFFNELLRISQNTEDGRKVSLLMATHSPYIVNNLNLLMKAFDCNTNVDGAAINYDELSVYHMQGGECRDLKIQNMHYVNTDRLSQDIIGIYEQYEKIKREAE